MMQGGSSMKLTLLVSIFTFLVFNKANSTTIAIIDSGTDI